MLLYRPGESSLHKGPDGLSRNPEGRDHLILAKSADWRSFRDRIRGICDAIVEGKAGDDEGEALTIEKLQKEDPAKLEPLPLKEGLAVSLKYEQGNRDRKSGKPARGRTRLRLRLSQRPTDMSNPVV